MYCNFFFSVIKCLIISLDLNKRFLCNSASFILDLF